MDQVSSQAGEVGLVSCPFLTRSTHSQPPRGLRVNTIVTPTHKNSRHCLPLGLDPDVRIWLQSCQGTCQDLCTSQSTPSQNNCFGQRAVNRCVRHFVFRVLCNSTQVSGYSVVSGKFFLQ
ncbi:hypothetical protein PAXRUDRAFT_584088 [Paxillus rubicundulus Ve08.2h10]|uniref:Uncharacterized protein n=1 Tax=Paxillus rubicundulus Ve08.2h10 TaxID=930991 RepID=A0A0D0D682_9AGAM|nr:hypothetical protein PAXRUDRAFT_584088 [Paxillus rubicundulus Ve08.2h10]